VAADAQMMLGHLTFALALRVLVPTIADQRQALTIMPSLLGRDVLAHFALFFEQRTGRVLLLEPAEADALDLR